MNERIAPMMNVVARDGMKAWARVVGNHVTPVRMARVAGEIVVVTASGIPVKIICTGL
jgi:hypothetical protein